MSHRAVIAVQTDDGIGFRSVYVHHNGYFTGLGMELINHFPKKEDAAKIIEKGDISEIKDGVIKSYNEMDDREEHTVSRPHANLEDLQFYTMDVGADFLAIYQDIPDKKPVFFNVCYDYDDMYFTRGYYFRMISNGFDVPQY